MAPVPVLSNAVIGSVPKLTRENYFDWKFAIEMLFRGRGCHDVATGVLTRDAASDKADWDKLAQEAFVIIGLTVDPSQYTYIRKKTVTNGPEAWKALQDVYEKNSRANRISLKHAFYGFTHDINRPIQDYITGVTTAASRLTAIGIDLTDEDISDVLIFNLDASYANIAGALTATRGTLTVADVTGALLDEEARRGGFQADDPLDPDVAMQASTARGPPNRGKRIRDTDRRTLTCYSCGKKGHVAYDCPDRADLREDDREAKEGKKKPKERSNFASTFADENDDDYNYDDELFEYHY